MTLDSAALDRQATLRLRGVELWRWNADAEARVPIIATLDWDVLPGERWALLGPNGAGKTTLLTIAGAVEFPSRGSVEVLGERLGRTLVHVLRERIGFVDARAGARFSPALTLGQVVATGATQTIGWFPERVSTESARRAVDLGERLGVDRLSDRRFADCSHGERTRALIARALVPRPRLLLLDEPGEGLDLPGRELLLQALDTLARDEPELALVLTTHHLEELPSSITHAILLRAGEIVARGPTETSLTSETLTRCFGLPVELRHDSGRWGATATR